MPLLDVFSIVSNEEELLPYCLESYVSISDLLGVCSLVDNNSTDSTLDIIDSYRDKLPIVLQHHRENANHGVMRTKALQPCKSPYIFYLDADETFDSTMRDWLLSEQYKAWGLIGFFKYTTILNRFHYVEGGNGHTWRMFRNDPGANFPQEIHTEPQSPQGWGNSILLDPNNSPLLFDHTATKSWEALWSKGWRYRWAHDAGIPAVGREGEYIWRVETALGPRKEFNKEFPEDIRRRIFTGP